MRLLFFPLLWPRCNEKKEKKVLFGVLVCVYRAYPIGRCVGSVCVSLLGDEWTEFFLLFGFGARGGAAT